MTKKTASILAAMITTIAFTSGCLEGSSVRTGLHLPPKPAFAPVDVFMGGEPLTPWAEVGLVSARGSGFNASMDDVVRVLQDQARGLGADAVIITDTWIEEEVWYDDAGYERVFERLFADGVAIHYL